MIVSQGQWGINEDQSGGTEINEKRMRMRDFSPVQQATGYRLPYDYKCVYICTYTVYGQNTIGIYITPLVLIQPTDVEQIAVNNNWLLRLQPVVKLQS